MTRGEDLRTTAPSRLLQQVTEKDFQAAVLDLARLHGWRHYHTHDSRRSPGGFPDLVLVRKGRLMFVELKSEEGRTSWEQEEWLHDLAKTAAEVHLWRPRDWPVIEETLR